MTISPNEAQKVISNMPLNDRKFVLLKAAYDLLKRCNESGYVLDPMSETVFYDDADCDGLCLLNDIAHEIGEDEVD